MKKLLTLLFVFGLTPLWGAPLYRAGQSKAHLPDFDRWELAAHGAVSSVSLTDFTGSNTLNGAKGVGLGGLYYLRPWLGVGAEGTYLLKQELPPFVEKYQALRGGLAAKFILSPDTLPRVYAVLGAGKTEYRLAYTKVPATAHWKRTAKRINYVRLGLGLETDLRKGFFIGIEAGALYNCATRLSTYYTLEKRWEFDGRFRAGVRF